MCIKKCIVCNSEIIKNPNEGTKYWETKKLCSRVCQFKYQVGRSVNKGTVRTEETKQKISKAKIGMCAGENHPGWKEKTIKNCKHCNNIMNLAPWESKRMFCTVKCKTNAFNKGITSENEKIRKSKVYKEWRISVFKRDDYTCQICNSRGGKLNADHIKGFSAFPELRLEISNGRTLCEICHRKTDNYGVKGNLKNLIGLTNGL